MHLTCYALQMKLGAMWVEFVSVSVMNSLICFNSTQLSDVGCAGREPGWFWSFGYRLWSNRNPRKCYCSISSGMEGDITPAAVASKRAWVSSQVMFSSTRSQTWRYPSIANSLSETIFIRDFRSCAGEFLGSSVFVYRSRRVRKPHWDEHWWACLRTWSKGYLWR